MGADGEPRRPLRLDHGDDRGRRLARDCARMAARLVLPEGAGGPARRRLRGVSVEGRARVTRLRPATDDDADLLVAWHADPEVSRYWDDETFTRDEILDLLHRPDVDTYIVEAEGGPVGLIEAWRERDE